MLLSRFWMILLAATTVGALAAGHLSRSFISRELGDDAQVALNRDHATIETALRHEARLRLDDIAPISASPTVQLALRQAGVRAPRRFGALTDRVEERLKQGNEKLAEHKADMLLALDKRGIVIAAIGTKQIQPGHSFAHYPVVKSALAGRLRDGLWLLQGSPYRIAARPVVFRGSYDGVIIHAKAFDRDLAQKLSQLTGGASVAFYQGSTIVASHVPANDPFATDAAAIKSGIEKALADADYRNKARSSTIELGANDLGVFAPMIGQGILFDVGYAIARPKRKVESIFALFDEASSEDMANIPVFTLLFLALLLIAIGFFLMWWEKDRLQRKLQISIQRVVRKEHERLDLTHFAGTFRNLAQDINHALDAIQSTSGTFTRAPTTLDSILGGSPTSSAGDFFAFGGGANKKDIPPSPSKKGPPPPPPPAPAAPRNSNSEIPTMNIPAENYSKLIAPANKPIPEDEDLTVISEVSQNFEMEPSASGPGAARKTRTSDGGSSSSTFEADYPRLYKEFIELKKKCGESTAGFTYDKFLTAIKRNRDHIVERHKAKNVQFTVYEKAGKAALKAKPVKK